MKTNTSKFYAVTAPHGAGKTPLCLQYLIDDDLSTPKNTIYSVPTLLAGEKIYDMLKGRTKRNVILMQRNMAEDVSRDLLKKIKKIAAAKSSNIIICLHSVVEPLGQFKTKDKWELIIDGAPLCEAYFGARLPCHPELLTDWLTTIDADVGNAGELYRLIFKEKQNKTRKNSNETLLKMKKIFKERFYDGVEAYVRPVLNDIINGKDVFVDAAKWHLFIKTGFSEECPIIRLVAPSMYTGFKHVIAMDAKLEETIWYKWMTDTYGVLFSKFEPISSKLPVNECTNYDRLKCVYLSEVAMDPDEFLKVGDRNMRRHRYNEIQVNNYFGRTPFIYTIGEADDCDHGKYSWEEDGYYDSRVDSEFMPSTLRGKEIVPLSYGLKYHNYHNLYFAPKLNISLPNTEILNCLGFDNAYIEREKIHNVLKNAIMRTSLALPDSTEPVTVVVPDKSYAEAVAKMFPGSKIESIDHSLVDDI